MTTCHYCGELAVHKLDGMQTCYDCSVRLAGIPEDLKIPTLVNNLRPSRSTWPHSRVIRKTKPIWLDEIARRLPLRHPRVRPHPQGCCRGPCG